jgi:acyl carrier protein
MVISSRTPEGEPGRCPLCGSDVRIEPSPLFGDAPCPNCGALLWFVGGSDESRLFFEYVAAEVIRERVLEILAAEMRRSKHELEANPPRVEDVGLDSLELVELMMELEEELQGRG